MTINELIEVLASIQHKHGDVDVGTWAQTANGTVLKHIQPRYNPELKMVTLDTWQQLAQSLQQ